MCMIVSLLKSTDDETQKSISNALKKAWMQ